MHPDQLTRRAPKLLALLSLFGVALLTGCVADPISPSQVTRLRILGLQPSPPAPSPGDQLTLDLLWADPPPACSSEEECATGRSCVDGRCLRDNDDVEIIWLVIPIAAWQADTAGLTDIFGASDGSATLDEAACAGIRTLFETLCAGPSICYPLAALFGGDFAGASPLLCCGDERASSVQLQVPSAIEVPEPTCNQDTSIDTSPTLQLQAQICVGGQLDLCGADLSSLSFGCVGEGAESVTTTSRVYLTAEQLDGNEAPVIEAPLWGRCEVEGEGSPDELCPELAWSEEAVLSVQGCQGTDCASRGCRQQSDCRVGQVCEENLCREELSIAMGGGAQETYLRPCDAAQTCSADSDCPSKFVCRDGTCLRIENPVSAFYATGGAFTPGRVVLDTNGDGRPEDERFATRWLPPTLDACEQADDPCGFGTCDPDLRLCVGEVSFWIVARDGRGGQDWLERVVRVVP